MSRWAEVAGSKREPELAPQGLGVYGCMGGQSKDAAGQPVLSLEKVAGHTDALSFPVSLASAISCKASSFPSPLFSFLNLGMEH